MLCHQLEDGSGQQPALF